MCLLVFLTVSLLLLFVWFSDNIVVVVCCCVFVVVVVVGGGGVVVVVVGVVVLFIVEVVGVVVLVVDAGSWVVFPCCGQRPQYLGQASFPRSLRQGSMGRSRHSRSIIWSLQTCTSGSK